MCVCVFPPVFESVSVTVFACWSVDVCVYVCVFTEASYGPYDVSQSSPNSLCRAIFSGLFPLAHLYCPTHDVIVSGRPPFSWLYSLYILICFTLNLGRVLHYVLISVSFICASDNWFCFYGGLYYLCFLIKMFCCYFVIFFSVILF